MKYYLNICNENYDKLDTKLIGEMNYDNKFSLRRICDSSGIDIKNIYKIYNLLSLNPVTLTEEEAYYDLYFSVIWIEEIVEKYKHKMIKLFLFIDE
jgi:hypothetical protein